MRRRPRKCVRVRVEAFSKAVRCLEGGAGLKTFAACGDLRHPSVFVCLYVLMPNTSETQIIQTKRQLCYQHICSNLHVIGRKYLILYTLSSVYHMRKLWTTMEPKFTPNGTHCEKVEVILKPSWSQTPTQDEGEKTPYSKSWPPVRYVCVAHRFVCEHVQFAEDASLF